MMHKELTLMLFAHEPQVITQAITAGIHDFMVDCEWRGKIDRQSGADTDTSYASFDSLNEAVAVRNAIINCRINGFGAWTDREIESAVENGASRIFLPMVRHMGEAEHFLKRIDGRARPAILIETDEAVRIAPDLATLPFEAVYVGLNDLAISRSYKVIFKALLDGTVDFLREVFQDVLFGFGGVTLLGCGHPCPSELLLAEMHRLNCDFSFLRRSYYRDVVGKDAFEEVIKLKTFWGNLAKLDKSSRTYQKQQLNHLVSDLILKS